MRTAFGLAGIAAALLAAPALAHHSFAMFDQSKVLYVSGTVEGLQFMNPHAWLEIVVNDKGTASMWSFEGGSVPQLVRLGWSKESFKVGDDVEVGFRPMKDGSRGGQLMSVKFSSGQKVCSNSRLRRRNRHHLERNAGGLNGGARPPAAVRPGLAQSKCPSGGNRMVMS